MPKIAPDPRKYCRFCKARMRRKRINGRMEDMAVFKRRKYCDRSCMAKGMVRQSVAKETYHHRARKFRGTSCVECGFKGVGKTGLHVHHIDGDYRNNTPNNLTTLCASCHLKLHWRENPNRKTRKSVPIEPLADLIDAALRASDILRNTSLGAELKSALKRLEGSVEHS